MNQAVRILHDFTVVDLVRELGFEAEPRITWPLGTVMRKLWQERTGELPEKRLRTKTIGKGSHCFAVYPGHFYYTARETTREFCEAIQAADRAQLGLFDDPEESD